MKHEIKLIGSLAVDSGLLRIGDPFYEIAADDQTGPKGILEHLPVVDEIATSQAFDFATPFGDGIYDVIGVYEDGRLSRVVIELGFE